jgi:hypothetical protein
LQVVFVPTTRTVRTTLLQVMDDIVVAVRSFHTIDGKMMTLIRLHEGALNKKQSFCPLSLGNSFCPCV